jgi:hypothetical protein
MAIETPLPEAGSRARTPGARVRFRTDLILDSAAALNFVQPCREFGRSRALLGSLIALIVTGMLCTGLSSRVPPHDDPLKPTIFSGRAWLRMFATLIGPAMVVGAIVRLVIQ